MKEPSVPKESPILTAHEAHPSPGISRKGEEPRYVVAARFYRRMKVQRAYPLVVNVSPSGGHLQGGKSHTPPVEIRPVIPGAQVTPAHYELGLTTGTTPAFYVTPLACGQLADSRLEVYSHGRLIQEIPVPMKGTRQRLTWILLVLTILIPFVIYYFTNHTRLSSSYSPVSAPAAVIPQNEPEEEEAADPTKGMTPEAKKKFGDDMRQRYGRGTPPGGSTPAEKAGNGKRGGANAEGAPAQPQSPRAVPHKPKSPVEKAALNVLPDFGSVGESQPISGQLAAGVQEVYDWADNLKADYLSFFVGLALLALTALSWILHAARRSRRRGQPIALGA